MAYQNENSNCSYYNTFGCKYKKYGKSEADIFSKVLVIFNNYSQFYIGDLFRNTFDNKNMNPSLGTGSTLLDGGSQALQEAIARRQTGQVGATGAVSPASPTFNPNAQIPQVQGQAPQPQMGGQPQQTQPIQPASPELPFSPSEIKMIVGALANRLKTLSSIQQGLTIGGQ